MAKIVEITNQEGLNKYKGKKYLLQFTADWCGPCKTLKPFMVNLVEQIDIDLLIISLNDRESEDSFERKMVDDFKVRGIPDVRLVENDIDTDLSILFRAQKLDLILKILA